jgi:hypothetical protein
MTVRVTEANVDMPGRAPQAVSSLVLGMLSILCIGPLCFVGLTLGIIGLRRARAGIAARKECPRLDGRTMLRVGRLCSIIGIVINALPVVAAFLLFAWIALVIVIGNVLGLPVE